MSGRAKDSQAPLLQVAEILGRLQHLYEAKNETALARTLGVPQSSLSSWKKRGSIPFALLLATAADLNVSLDWLIFGKGTLERDLHGEMDKKLLSLAIRTALRVELGDELSTQRIESEILRHYSQFSSFFRAAHKHAKLDRAEAYKATESMAKSIAAELSAKN